MLLLKHVAEVYLIRKIEVEHLIIINFIMKKIEAVKKVLHLD